MFAEQVTFLHQSNQKQKQLYCWPQDFYYNMLTRKTEIINIITTHITHHLKAIYAFANHKQGITSLFKNSKRNKKTQDSIPYKEMIVNSVKDKVNKKLAIARHVVVPAPQRYSQSIGQPTAQTITQIDSALNGNDESMKQNDIKSVLEQHPNTTPKYYKLLIKNFDKTETRKQMFFFWQLTKRKDRLHLNRDKKYYQDIAEEKYIDIVKEEIKRINFYSSTMVYEIDFRNFRANHFIEEHVEGIYSVIMGEMRERKVASKQFMFITGNGISEGVQPNLSRQLQIWCFQKRYMGQLDYQRVNDRVKNQSGYLITFKIKSESME